MQKTASAAHADSKPHYELLNGLRGVAAIMVIFYHIFEGYATSPFDQKFNHGYLAVDFFFVLSGFVIGYAYDNRWGKMTVGGFAKRRLIRLQPMVVMGAVLGTITFFIQGSVQWDGTQIPFLMVMLAMLLTMFLIPVAPGMGAEVRGNGEMYPLNGPAWSLLFEYIANILYALFLRKLSTKALTVLVVIAGIALACFSVFNLSGYYNLGVGWTMADFSFLGGCLRILFSFSAGMLISRKFKPIKIKNAFLICSATIVVLLSMPYIGGGEMNILNGIYDAACIIIVFPLLVWLGASGKVGSKRSSMVYRFLGDISYPLYMVHYPFMYLFYAWLWRNNLTFAETWPVALLMLFGNIILAYIVLKAYDEPVRKWLKKISKI